MKLEGRLLDVAELTSAHRGEMYALMIRYYENVKHAEFSRDLDEKKWVIHVTNPTTGQLCGFSTQTLLQVDSNTKPIRALFSGDTIIDEQYRMSNPLTQLWGRLVLSLIEQYPEEELYWFLISKGYKTYRFLPVFFHEFYPRFDLAIPQWASGHIEVLGRHKFPESYDSTSGIIRSSEEGCRLRAGIADVTKRRLNDPHVQYFTRINPGYADGDELCCIAPLTRENFKAAAYRVIGTERFDSTAPV